MTTVFGSSDDLIEFEGDLYGEVNCYGTDDNEKGVLVMFSDGTLLDVGYCKHHSGIWGIKVVKKGELFDRIDSCEEETDKLYSDMAHFKDGLKWAYAATEWERVK